MLLLTPAKARIYREFLPDDFSFLPEADARYQLAVETLRKSGALVPDLATALNDLHQKDPGTALFFKADTHWTGAASEAAAQVTGAQMLATFKLPPSARPGTQLGKAVTQTFFDNDLVHEMSNMQKSEYPPETFQVHASVASGAAALLDDDTADVAVVGNSYMQPKFNFSATLSNVLNRPVGLVWRFHSSGSYRALLIYLQSEAFKKKKPKVIVWNFHEVDMEISVDSAVAWPQDYMAVDVFLGNVKKALA